MTAIESLNKGTTSSADQTPVSLAEVVCEALGVVNQNTHFVNIDIFGVLPDVLGDPKQLQAVVENLLQHAMDSSPENTTVWITTSVEPDTVSLAVSDEGSGVPEIDMRMFVTKTLVEAMGGQLEVKSKLGRGTTFSVKFQRVEK